MVLKEHCWVFEKEFNNYFCDDVIKLGNQTNKKTGLIDNNIIPSKKIRDSNICFFNDFWIQQWFDNYFHIANKNAGWNFQFNSYESFQFTEYKKNQHYGWHVDGFVHESNIRKLSGIILLSDPEDYVGGEIKFMTGKDRYINLGKKPKGTIIIFPSFVYHKVNPVKNGTRYSLVIWANGENSK
jgi:PKHD-type hydroxylase